MSTRNSQENIAPAPAEQSRPSRDSGKRSLKVPASTSARPSQDGGTRALFSAGATALAPKLSMQSVRPSIVKSSRSSINNEKTGIKTEVDQVSASDHEKQSVHHFTTSGDAYLVDEDGCVRRMPIPSKDPNDPLNFSKAKKIGILICCCWFSIFSLVLVGGLGPLLSVFAIVYLPEGKQFEDVANLSNYPSLAMACGAFIILPAAMIYGRRPTFLFCSLFLLASTVGAGASATYDQHMACRILQGIATGATESVLPLIITDISFLDERGFYYGIYWGSQAFINSLFLICNSYLVNDLGWRWFYWIMAILTAAGFVLGFFVLVETKYVRLPTAVGDRVVHTDAWGVTRVLSVEEASKEFGDVHGVAEGDEQPEKRSYAQTLNPWSGQARNPLKIFLDTNLKMLQCLSSPAIIFAICLAAIGLGVGIAMALTYSIVLTSLYQWSYASVGLINIGVFPASIAATVYTGYFGDKINLRLAKRRGGVHLPEDTLTQLVLPFFIGIIGITVYAVVAQNPFKYSWWGIAMGWTLYNFANTTILVIATQFGAEAYPKNPGPGVTVVIGTKNIVSFGASYGISPMITKWGFLKSYMVLNAFFIGILLCGIPVYIFNQKWRRAVGNRNQ